MFYFFRSLVFAVSLVSLFAGSTSYSQSLPVRDKNVEAQLIASVATIRAGEPFTLALKLKIDPTWHTYWINPGDAGKPTKLTLELPPGFTAADIRFPIPEKVIIDYGGGYRQVSIGYQREVIHPLTVTPPASLKEGDQITIKGQAEWLMCDPNTCVPGKADLSLTLRVGGISGPSAETEKIQEVMANLPKPKDWKTTASDEGDSIKLSVKIPGNAKFPKGEMEFFPINRNVVDLLKTPKFSWQGDTLRIRLPRHESLNKLPDTFSGLLAVTRGTGKSGFLISTDPRREVTETSVPKTETSTGTGNSEARQADLPFGGGLAAMLLAAFLGGMMLNIMPCVFPVISLKVMSFIGQAGEDRKKVWMHSLAFALGILIFFWILTAILLVMRSAGSADVGWGVQMRHPAFVLALILVMVIVALSLFGVVELGAGLVGVGGNLVRKSGYAGSFWSGALAVLLATPCTAPLMAPAIGFAFTQPAPSMIGIFTALALGLAVPYLLLAAFPRFLALIPAPGAWMDSFKQAMGFPMLAVAIWLIGVLSKQLTTEGLQWALAGVLLIALAMWISGRFVRPDSTRSSRVKGRVFAVLFAVGGLVVAFYAKNERAKPSGIDIRQVISEHRKAGKNVFVDFTADWCVTCKANEYATIRSKAVQQALKDHQIEFVVADWTNPDPSIAALLKKHGRAGVPLYLLYPADQSKEAIMLKEGIITPGDVLEAIEKLPGK